jgi:glutathione synthase/RimK-type ligase-like ATP-grasp enzyme
MNIPVSTASAGAQTPTTIGLASLARMAFAGVDLNPLGRQLIERANANPQDAGTLMDLSMLLQLAGDRANGIAVQAQALQLQRLYRQPPAAPARDGIRLLALVVPGDFMANTPLEFLLDGSDVTLDKLYLGPGPNQEIPDHDLAIVAIGESDENRPALRQLEQLLRLWPRPVLNRPDRIARLSRDNAPSLLQSLPGVVMPTSQRVDRDALVHAALPFPIIARPVGSHAGKGLAKLDDDGAVGTFLQERPEREFYVSPFIDYRGADGLFRKYRIVLIDGRPWICHMAISKHWMVHYLNAGMYDSAAKRDEEARVMARFDEEFARRHAKALTAVCERIGLDYFGLDCAETPDGELLIFEADVAMIVHAMDSPDMFPYKQQQMHKVFAAFRDMLCRARVARAA